MKYLALAIAVLACNTAHAIEKCQDENGRWHYGDVAVEACNTAKVTTLNDHGTITDELDAPKTEEQLRVEAEELAKAEAIENAEREAAEEKMRILSIYETEDDIERLRDNQLNSVQSNIDVHEAYLKSMEKRISRYERELAEAKTEPAKQKVQSRIDAAKQRTQKFADELSVLTAQKGEIVQKFADEKTLYRKLKSSDEHAD